MALKIEEQELSVEIIQKFDRPVPRYTSYPTVPFWKNDYGPQQFLDAIEKAGQKQEPLSIYFHIPFCERRCAFCGCNTHITKRKSRGTEYLDTLLQIEMKTISERLGERRKYSQLHLGGGTPTFLTPKQLQRLFTTFNETFEPVKHAEQSIEIHPSVTTEEHILTLLDNGINRLSLGVQDFDPLVQEKIRRYQTFEETKHIIEFARDHGVLSINIDLIYGLPYQTKQGFKKTMELINQIRPDRLAVYSYAHLPKIFKHQSIFPEDKIPRGKEKLELFLIARNSLIENGYRQIGFDHFALPTDDLWKAYKEETLQRNFMGYTTKAGTDLIAFGYSSISDINNTYAQNTKDLWKYHELTKKYGVSTIRGIKLTPDDVARKDAIMTWLCQFKINTKELRDKHKSAAEALIKDIETHFPTYEKIGLTERVAPEQWKATALGRLFARVVAASLDKYIKNGTPDVLFSQSI